MNIEINSLKGQSISSSPNNSKKLSILCNISSVVYAVKVQVLYNCPT